RFAPVCNVMLVSARIFPRKVVAVPNVAELPTRQNTLHAWPPLIKETVEPDPVMSVLAVWKTQTAFASPCASSVSEPVFDAEDAKQYTPGARFIPARSVGTPNDVLHAWLAR